MLDLHLATFRTDASPPPGHPLCGGWIAPVSGQDDPQWLRGVVLMGAGLPIVVAALDWTGVLNDCHRQWTEALALAAHTTPDRVALHCVHQHNAPFVDRHGDALLQRLGAGTRIYDPAFFAALVHRSAADLRASLDTAQPVSHVRYGAAQVEQVASNRRVLGPDGKIQFTRTSATTDPVARAAPEGLIDPWLRSIAFCRGDRPLARLYAYTTHPMSYYGDGQVTSDFVGLARDRRDREEPGTLHLYLTGAAGDITAGKYNNGSKPNRVVLANRVHSAMLAADRIADTASRPLDRIDWRTAPIRFAPRADLDRDQLEAIVANDHESTANRHRAAMACGWLARLETDRPILLGRLDLPGVTLLCLPAETFVSYQLEAQAIDPETPLLTAAYGDGGPWYIPLRRSFDEGGYEPSVALVSQDTEPLYRQAIAELLHRGR